MKYIKAATSSNLGNVVSVTAASAFLPFLPMLPIQLLVQNLTYDLSQLAIPWDRVDPEETQRPQRWDSAALRRFVIRVGPLSSIFDLATWIALCRLFGAGSAHPELFQTGWFVEGLLTQVLAVHIIRTRRPPHPFRRSGSGTGSGSGSGAGVGSDPRPGSGTSSRPGRALLATTGAALAFALASPFTPLAGPLGMHQLPPGYYAVLAPIVLGYLAALRLGIVKYALRGR